MVMPPNSLGQHLLQTARQGEGRATMGSEKEGEPPGKGGSSGEPGGCAGEGAKPDLQGFQRGLGNEGFWKRVLYN